ncbi:MaoC family dehydratase N-terminal domain-containing protein [Chloroflexota bacterium]
MTAKPYREFGEPFETPSRHVDGGGDWEFFEPIRPGDIITVTTQIADVYERTGKSGTMLFVVFELLHKNQNEQLACICRKTRIYF